VSYGDDPVHELGEKDISRFRQLPDLLSEIANLIENGIYEHFKSRSSNCIRLRYKNAIKRCDDNGIEYRA
jgi:hypothetical protein